MTPEILSLLVDSKTPQGIVAEIALEQPELPDQLQGRFLYLEDVQDPGNVGTMIRTADAAGFDGVMLSKASADLYSLKTPSIHAGQSFPYSYLETGSRRTIGTSCTLSSTSSRNDAFRSFH